MDDGSVDVRRLRERLDEIETKNSKLTDEITVMKAYANDMKLYRESFSEVVNSIMNALASSINNDQGSSPLVTNTRGVGGSFQGSSGIKNDATEAQFTRVNVAQFTRVNVATLPRSNSLDLVAAVDAVPMTQYTPFFTKAAHSIPSSPSSSSSETAIPDNHYYFAIPPSAVKDNICLLIRDLFPYVTFTHFMSKFFP